MKKLWIKIQKIYFHFLLNTFYHYLINNISEKYIKYGHSRTLYSVDNIKKTYVNGHVSKPVFKRLWFKQFLAECFFLAANTPIEKEVKKQGRNELCFCGSGRKVKRCCLVILDNVQKKL